MKKFIEMVKALHEEGKSKDEVVAAVVEAMMADGMEMKHALPKAPKIIKDAGVKFRRSKGTTWKDLAAEAFIENPELTREEMLAAIEGSTKDDAYYVKTWYATFSKLAKA